jgi:phage shock protein C
MVHRSRTHRVVAGVAGGLAEHWGLSPAFIRIGWIALTILTAGIVGVVYIILALVLPIAPADTPAGYEAPLSGADTRRRGALYWAIVVVVALMVVTFVLMLALSVSGIYR